MKIHNSALIVSLVAMFLEPHTDSFASQSRSVTLNCDLGNKPTTKILRFWSALNFEPQAAEVWAAEANKRSVEDSIDKRLPPGAPMKISLGMALGGLPISTLPGLNLP